MSFFDDNFRDKSFFLTVNEYKQVIDRKESEAEGEGGPRVKAHRGIESLTMRYCITNTA